MRMKKALAGMLSVAVVLPAFAVNVLASANEYVFNDGKLTIESEEGLTNVNNDIESGSLTATDITEVIFEYESISSYDEGFADFFKIATNVKDLTFVGDTDISGIFYDKASLETVTFEGDAKISSGFDHCINLKKVEFNGDAEIACAFRLCENLEDVTFGGEVSLENQTFNYTGIKSLEFPTTSYVYYSVSQCPELESVTFADDTDIRHISFASCPKLDKVEFLGEASIISSSFAGSLNISELTFKDYVYMEYAFNELEVLETLRFDSTSKLHGSFGGCKVLEEVTFCDDTDLDAGPFGSCGELKEVTFLGKCDILNVPFQYADKLETITFYDEINTITNQFGAKNLKTVVFKSETVPELPDLLFGLQKNIETIIVPAASKDAYYNAFYSNDNHAYAGDGLTTNRDLAPLIKCEVVVDFNMNNIGTQVESQKFLDGNKVTNPGVPVAEGYKFIGWFKDSNLTEEFSFDTVITTDTTIYAKWEKVPVVPSTPEKPETPVTPSVPSTPANPITPPYPTLEPESGLPGFIERLYNVALSRDSEETGKNWWINKVKFEEYTGSDVAKGFLESDEFLNKQMTNEDFLEVLYKTYFDRASDSQGKAYWLNLMDNGATKKDVIDGFCNSTEWANLCLTYGIPSGSSATPTITIEPNEGTKAFVLRLYQTCLGREPELAGFQYWTYRLANMQERGSSAAYGFFTSPEFTGKGYDNETYVTLLYRTILGREPDQAGLNYWLGLMANGMNRVDVLNGFVASTEWADICTRYAILK